MVHFCFDFVFHVDGLRACGDRDRSFMVSRAEEEENQVRMEEAEANLQHTYWNQEQGPSILSFFLWVGGERERQAKSSPQTSQGNDEGRVCVR